MGFQLLETLHLGSQATVLRARRDEDKVGVVVKLGVGDRFAQRARFLAALDLSRAAAHPRIVRHQSVETHLSMPVLVSADTGGRSLDRIAGGLPLPVKQVLRIGIEVADGLARLHQLGFVHRDIKPANIIVDRSGCATIIDLEHAAKAAHLADQVTAGEPMQGTPLYMAPEQSGRANRTVDGRADLYSLGATLYELLSGSPPFTGVDDRALIHAHLAVRPEPLHIRRPDVPLPLALVVARLLAKTPEDRYQSTHALRLDLARCLDELNATGTIAAFEPAADDRPAELRVSQRLYGRAREIRGLLLAFDRIRGGGVEVIALSGPSGIGKTALIRELGLPVQREGGRLARGSSGGMAAPLTALTEALGELVLDTLAGSEPHTLVVRRNLDLAIGARRERLIALVPAAAMMLGLPGSAASGRAVPGQGDVELLVDAIRPFASSAHPLVLLLDDLHHPDPLLLEAVETLARQAELNLLLVLAWQDGPSAAVRALRAATEDLEFDGIPVERMHLGPLARESVDVLVADTLHQDLESTAALSARLHASAEGNPFLTAHQVVHLNKTGALAVDPRHGRWTWDLAALDTPDLPRTTHDVIEAASREMSAATRGRLFAVAPIGRRFSLEDCWGGELEPLVAAAQDLVGAVEAGFLIPLDPRWKRVGLEDASTADGPPGTTWQQVAYHFASDRHWNWALAADSAGASVGPGAGPARRSKPPAAPPELAAPLGETEASRASDPRSVHRRTIVQTLQAADRARQAGNHPGAETLYTSALDGAAGLQSDDASALRRRALVGLLMAMIRGGTPARAMSLVNTLPPPTLRLLSGDLPTLQVEAHLRAGAWQAALEAALRHIDPTLSADASPERLGALAEAITDGAPAPDQRFHLEDPFTLGKGRAVALASEAALGLPALHRVLSLVAERWVDDEAELGDRALVLAHRAVALQRFGELQAARRTADLAWEHARSDSSPAVTLLLATTVRAGTTSRTELSKVIDAAAARIDQPRTAALAGVDARWVAFSRQQPLREQLDAVDMTLDRAWQALRDPAAARALGRLADDLRALAAPHNHRHVKEPAQWPDPIMPPQVQAASALHRLACAVLGGDGERLAECLELLDQSGGALTGHYLEVDQAFWQAIALSMGGRDQLTPAARLELLTHDAAVLRSRARAVPEDGEAAALLVEGLLAIASGEPGDAALRFEAAADTAEAAGQTATYALALELAADRLDAQGRARPARAYRNDAYAAWARWGNTRRVRQLIRAHPHLRRGARSEQDSASLDLGTVVQATETLTGATMLDQLLLRLIRMVLEHAGAERARLFLVRQGAAYLDAAGGVGEAPSVLQARPLRECQDVPESVIHYALRTRQVVVVADASDHPRFANDPAIRGQGPRSVLCAPLERQGEVIGALYLDNTLVTGAFTSDRVDLLQVLASLAATSVINARLFAGLEDRSRSLAELVEDREQQVARLHRRNTHILLALTEGVALVEPSGAIEWLNHTAATLLGWEEAQLVGRHISAILPHLDAGAEGASPGPEAVQARTRDGDSIPVELTLRPLREGNTISGHVLAFHDLRERLRLEARVQQAQKMEVMGSFAGGLAHDFNNLLTPLMGHVAMLSERLGDDETAHSHLQVIERGAERAAGLVRQMQAFGRQQELFRQPVDLGAVVGEVAALLARTLDDNVALRVTTAEGLPRVMADTGQLHQVLMNLCVNARDAIAARPGGNGGCIDVSVALAAATDDHPRQLVLSVTDDGVGIAPDVADRVFEPFFSTKDRARGGGLGLAIVADITRQHGGAVAFDSEPGRGATIRVTLPALDEATQRIGRTPSVAPEGCILVVDDDDGVRAVGRAILEHAGYEVVEANDGGVALERLRIDPYRYSGVLLDLSMPFLSGRETLAEMLLIRADLPVVVWTGHAGADGAESLQSLGARGFLTKPVRPALLVDTLQTAIGA